MFTLKAYIAGPMSGIPQMNIPAFDAAAWALRAKGWEIVSPAELDDPKIRAECLQSPEGKPDPTHGTWGEFLSRDVKIVADQVDVVILLPGWEDSKGANLEAIVGILSNKKFFEYKNGKLEFIGHTTVRNLLNVLNRA